MFSPRVFIIALTNKEQLQKDVSHLLYDSRKDYFLHTDRGSGDYYPASDFYGVSLFNTVEEAKTALNYCKQYDPVICHIVCQSIGL